MTLRASSRVALLLLAVILVPRHAQPQPAAAPLALLDVPFISQSESLCGGAAAAMVLRYWGERAINADAFASLVDRSAAGIRTNVLLDDLRGRGWNAIQIEGTSDALDRELGRGRPPLLLIEDRPGAYHYVVVVGVTGRAMVFHDPARVPFRVMSRDEFDRRWASARRWMAIVLPGAARERETSPPAVVPPASSECEGLVSRGVQQARANEVDAASQTLTSALACGGAAPLRELAGVRLLQKRWPEVTDLASAALAEDPKDDQAWRLLATSRFVQDDRLGALQAWNNVREPRVDRIAILGLEKTRQPVVETLVGVRSNAVLTTGLYTSARRRLRELPSASSAELEYVPVGSGLAELRGTVSERRLLPLDRMGLATIGFNALFRREIDVSIGPLTGGGDRLTIGWRFWPNRERVSVAFTAPAPWGGIWGVDAFNERQPFKQDAFPVARRRGGHLSTAIWATHWARVGVRGGVEHWNGLGDFGLFGGAVRLATPDDRIDGRIELTRWTGTGDLSSFGTAEIGGTIRSTTERRGRVWIARAGAAGASDATPPDIWFAGDTGRARGVPLRAHPVVDGGRLDPEQIGRRIHYASGEVQQWWSYKTRAQIGGAFFVDSVRASRRLNPDPKVDVDVGIGLRLSSPGFGGLVRIDIAHGVRDGDDAISFVYEP
jgi:hypothetical protein